MQFLLLSLALGVATAAPLPQLTSTLDNTVASVENELGTSLPALPRSRRDVPNIGLGLNPSALENGVETELVELNVRDNDGLPTLNPSELTGELGSTLGGIDGETTPRIGTTDTGDLPLRRRQTDTSSSSANSALAQVETAVDNTELTVDQQMPNVTVLAPLEGAAADLTTGVENGVNAMTDSDVSDPSGQAVEDVVGGVKLAGETLENGSNEDAPAPVSTSEKRQLTGELSGVVGEVEGETSGLSGELGALGKRQLTGGLNGVVGEVEGEASGLDGELGALRS